ncbi:DUF4173 domain-containing protein [Candidatus Parabeggiatoa sp. HSG14]|uniref:DUF4153 domain-containing protein n=1 Tax=Candidatus Parabeggiatoa sp. HSG14 TaxID=3055593 RepID=UPI0025A7E56D|nr:DUF4173 domain-containing protein [Thiotrichales bacterium HSG14]
MIDRIELPIHFTHSIKRMLPLITLSTCLLLGVVGIFLFNSQTWGLNIVLFGLLSVISLLLLRYLGEHPLGYLEYALIISGLFFLTSLAWRDSLVLNSLSLLGIFLTISLAFTLATRRRLQRLDISEAIQDVYWLGRYCVTSYYELINKDVPWSDVQERWGQFGRAVLRGYAITIPLVLIFGLLLMASDAYFEASVKETLDWNWSRKAIAWLVVTFIISGWITAAILRGGVLREGLVINKGFSPLSTWELGTVEITIILGTINILFLSFIVVQFTYLFAGDILVQSFFGPSYADYARRAFFQLVIVALLMIILLFLMHWLHRPKHYWERKLFQVLAMLIVVMTMIIETSAVYRMSLYTHVYGLTELRFYTNVFMAWLVVLFLWFSITLLLEQRKRFIFGAVLTAMVFISGLLILNPDAHIVKTNLMYAKKVGQEFDTTYTTSLSADAIPTLLEALPNIPKPHRCKLWYHLQTHPVLRASKDWRDWHWSRYQAQKLWLPVSPKGCQWTF